MAVGSTNILPLLKQ